MLLLIINTAAVEEVNSISVLDQGHLFQLFEGQIALHIHSIMIFSTVIETLKLYNCGYGPDNKKVQFKNIKIQSWLDQSTGWFRKFEIIATGG